MSTPLGHLMTSCIFSRTIEKSGAPKCRTALYLGMAAASSLMDLDNLVLLMGFEATHRELSHGLILVPVGGLLVGWIFKRFLAKSFREGFIWGCVAWVTHIILDMGSSLTGPMLLAPFSEQRFTWPIHFLPVAEPHLGGLYFNGIVMAFETALYGSLLFFVWRRRSALAKSVVLLIFIFALLGSVRQSNFRYHFFADATEKQNAWYEQHLDRLSPLDFALFREARYQ